MSKARRFLVNTKRCKREDGNAIIDHSQLHPMKLQINCISHSDRRGMVWCLLMCQRWVLPSHSSFFFNLFRKHWHHIKSYFSHFWYLEYQNVSHTKETSRATQNLNRLLVFCILAPTESSLSSSDRIGLNIKRVTSCRPKLSMTINRLVPLRAPGFYCSLWYFLTTVHYLPILLSKRYRIQDGRVRL